jgi:hypothetical protein
MLDSLRLTTYELLFWEIVSDVAFGVSVDNVKSEGTYEKQWELIVLKLIQEVLGRTNNST